jgi:outer membrane protein assembly factor BamB
VNDTIAFLARLKWVYTTSGGAIYYSSPAIGSDGTIYVANGAPFNRGETRGLYAINPDGTLKWSYLRGTPTIGDWGFMSSPVLGPDGTIYMQDESSHLYAVNPDGTLKWSYTAISLGLGVGLPTPSVGSDGTIYAGADTVYAFNPDGTLKWTGPFEASGVFRSGFAIAADGTIYAGGSGYFPGATTYGAALVAINPDGTVKWVHPMPGTSFTFSSPAIGADGTVYLGAESNAADTDNNYVYAINPDGTLKWRYVVDRGRTVRSSPAIGSDGTIYIGTKAGPVVNAVFLALNPDGTLKWSFPIDAFAADIYCSPTIGANGIIYFGAETGYLFALNPDGTLAWKYLTNNGINWTSPAIASDGTIYIGNNDGKLFAINSNSLGLAGSPWPKVHHDNKNTGRSN